MRKLDFLLRHLLTELELPVPQPCDLDHFMDIVTDQRSRRGARATIVLMDDVGAGLASPELSQAFWDSLRSVVSTAADGSLAFLVTAHDDPARLAEGQSKTSLFFNIFNTLELGSFTEAEARQFLAAMPGSPPEAEVAWMIEQSQRWPCLLQILGEEWWLAQQDGDAKDNDSDNDNEEWKREGLKRIAHMSHLLT